MASDGNYLSSRVADRLIELIALKEFGVGDPLPAESELAERFGVSKPVVREALKQLAVFGVVELRQGRVARIRALDSSALEGFYRLAIRSSDNGFREAVELRRAVEVDLAELAAKRGTTETLAPLHAAFLKMQRNVDSLEPWLEGDFAFHMALADASGNSIMRHTLHGLSGVLRYTMRVLGLQSDLRDARVTLRRHQLVLDAVMAGDGPAAAIAMRQHFDVLWPFVDIISNDRSRLARI
ncbi:MULTISPECIES: FadR/GntR family transcriptional regulator [unclassified Chelatococcus]|uniref:FadR/GntR family transcriptional regulator n=1 Tax=unclassified Chelatococcus TaxID=2638111 RepID=UPI001BD0B9C9|nr:MULTISPECIES: FadR/GntR family transcriptional regulator [unclassified Chelatococcus]MBS7700110.1 FadR family transcriptional regulator [Chelatococcus sp. YT9]MBX3556803.1 FadR family transcriptional regulator [Chelatococcus sp.]